MKAFLTDEIWKDIVGYEGQYCVSNYGRIKALPRFVIRKNQSNGYFTKERIINPIHKDNGYLYVTIGNTKEKTLANKYIHRLVAEAFIPNPHSKPCVNHIDYDRSNNCLENLEWVTYVENVRHSSGNLSKAILNKSINSKTTKGISLKNNRYEVTFKSKYIGRFKDYKDAVACRRNVEEMYMKEGLK